MNEKFDRAVHEHVPAADTPKDEAPPPFGILMREGLTEARPLGNPHL